jgi:S-adenosyl methyltransferase
MTHDAPHLDTSTAHPARRYNYWLGGKDNFAVDRDSADKIEAQYPDIRTSAFENRGFLKRTVRHLAGDAGIRQFLDIGTGLPTADNTHEIAQAVAEQSQVVYVDNDPLVLAHARALLTSSPAGATAYIDGDLRDPQRIIGLARKLLDFTQPIAVMLVAVLHFIADDEQAYAVVRELLGQLAPGSYLAASHATGDFLDDVTREQLSQYDFVLRDRDGFAGFFTGLELAEPGISPITLWRPEGDTIIAPEQASVYGALARVPGPVPARHDR